MAKKKNKNSAKYVGIAVLLLAGIGIYYYMSDDKKSESNSNNTDTDTDTDTDTNSNNTDTNSNNTDTNSNDSNSNNTDTNSNDTNSNTKPYWYEFAHPSKNYEEITNEELDVLFDNIFIPNSAIMRISPHNNVERVNYIFMKRTGDVVEDLDQDFFTTLLNYASKQLSSTEQINGKYYSCIYAVHKK